MMLGAVLTFTFAQTLGWPLLAALPLALALCALYGTVVERLAVRPFASRGSNAWLMSTVALGIVLDNLVMFTFGKEPRSLPSPLAQAPLEIDGLGLGVYPLQLLIPLVGLALAAALHALSRRTLGSGAACGGAEPERGAPDGHSGAARHHGRLCRLDPVRGRGRRAGRAAVQRAGRHGHPVPD